MYGSRKSVSGRKMVTNTGLKVSAKKTFSDNLGRSPRTNRGSYPQWRTNSLINGNRTITINSLTELREYEFIVRLVKLFNSNQWLFQPQF